MIIASLYAFCRVDNTPSPLSSKMSSDALINALSYLEVGEQNACKTLCKVDRNKITSKVQSLAIKNLLQGGKTHSLSDLSEYFRVYRGLSGEKLDPKYVRGLDLSRDAVVDSYYSSIAESSSTTELFVSSLGVRFDQNCMDDEQLATIVSNFPDLRRLKVDCESDDFIAQIADRVQKLQDLEVWIDSPKENMTSYIAKFKDLRSLNLYKNWSNDAPFQIAEFATLKKLERLKFSGHWIPEEDLLALSHFKLRVFSIECCAITHFSRIPNFRHLESLRFDRREISDQQLESLCNHEHLQHLSIRCVNRKIPENIVKKLARIKNLKSFEIDGREINIPPPLLQRVKNVWRSGVSIVRENRVEIGLLACGFAISWPVTGALCALTNVLFIRPALSLVDLRNHG